jgi:hypothetical protein
LLASQAQARSSFWVVSGFKDIEEFKVDPAGSPSQYCLIEKAMALAEDCATFAIFHNVLEDVRQ